MPIATFQNKVFKVSGNSKYFFDGLTWSTALNTESQEKLSSKPSTYIKGDGLSTMSFSIPLLAVLGLNVRKEIDSWESIRSKATPGIFILGTHPLGKNKWLLKSVAISDTEVDGRGMLRKAILKLDFEEYVRAGKAEAKKTASGVSTTSTLQPTPYIEPANKAEEKRFNPNASDSLKRLYGKGGF